MRRATALVAAAALLAVTAAAGCGGKSDDQQVRDALRQFNAAIASKNYGALCGRLLARRLLTALDRAGVPCQAALSAGLGDVQEPTLQVLRVRAKGGSALAVVRSGAVGQAPLTATIQLAREGGRWRVASLAQQGAEARGSETVTMPTTTTPPPTTTAPPTRTGLPGRTTTTP